MSNTAAHKLHVSSNISCVCATCVSLFNFRHLRDFTSPTSRRGTLLLLCTNHVSFSDILNLFLRRPWVFSRTVGCGHEGGPPVYHGGSLSPGPLRGACSGRSRSRNLASNHGVALRGDRVEQDDGEPTCRLICSNSVNALYMVAATVKSSRTSILCGPPLSTCGHCICLSVVWCDSCACV